MTIDMKFFNVYYFCHLANESMGKFDYASTNAEFIERQFEVEPEDFPRTSVLREYCWWLVDRVFYEQANHIAQTEEVADFNPIAWINQAIMKYKNINVSSLKKFECNENDFLEKFNQYIEFLDTVCEDLYFEIIGDIAIEVEFILFQNRDFLLRFNDQVAVMFREHPRKRAYVPEWVKRAVLFRDRGCCVFCKKDLTGLYSLLEDNEKHFDHIVPLNEGGINDVCNMQLSCQDCSLSKSDNSMTSSLYQSAY